ncbi:hypothetical protein ACLOAV_003030 [Pseudogymnoascus australis]
MTSHDTYPLQLLPTTSTLSLKSTLKTSSLKNPFDTASILTTSTRYSQSTLRPPPPYTPFHATSSLQIQSSGHALLAFPSPPKQLTTAIFSLSPSGRCDRPVHLSTRAVRNSGNCTLVRAEDESATPLAETTYRWGPSSPPVVRVGGEEVVMEKRRWTSRTVGFGWGGRRYEWRYGGSAEKRGVEAERGEECEDDGGAFSEGGGDADARNEEELCGEWGRLEMALEKGSGDVFVEGITEEVVVATVLVMLKKEIDCRRASQIAVIVNMKGIVLPWYVIQHMRQKNAPQPEY